MKANELWRALLYVGNRDLTVAQLSEILFGMKDQDAELGENFDATADAAQGVTVWTVVNERYTIGREVVLDLLKNGVLELYSNPINKIAAYVKHYGADEDLYREEQMPQPITVKAMRDQDRARKNYYNWLSAQDVLDAKAKQRE